MKNIFSSCGLLLLLLFAACNKQPKADFSFEDKTYYTFEIVNFQSNSENANRYVWVIDGVEYASRISSDFQHTFQGPGTREVTLRVESKNGKKTDEITKTIEILDAALKYVGTYQVDEGYYSNGCGFDEYTYDLILEYHSVGTLKAKNIFNAFDNIYLQVYGNSFNIKAQQKVKDKSNYEWDICEGTSCTGWFTGNSVYLSGYITDKNYRDICQDIQFSGQGFKK